MARATTALYARRSPRVLFSSGGASIISWSVGVSQSRSLVYRHTCVRRRCRPLARARTGLMWQDVRRIARATAEILLYEFARNAHAHTRASHVSAIAACDTTIILLTFACPACCCCVPHLFVCSAQRVRKTIPAGSVHSSPHLFRFYHIRYTYS